MTAVSEQFYRPKPTSYDIPYLVERATDGLLRVPSFQRNYVWDAEDVRKLFDSIWRGFPIGTLLLWRNKADAGEVKLGPINIDVPSRTDALWVVDGQQRLISLVGVLSKSLRGIDDRFEIYFDLRRQRFVTSGKAHVPATWLPLRVAIETRSLLAWLREHEVDLEEKDFDVADALGGALRDYQVPAYIVENNDDRVLREVFDRVNSAGKPIRRAAIFHALFASDTDPGSPSSVVESLKRLEFGAIEPERVVQSLLAIRGGDVQRDLHDEFSPDEELSDWYDKTDLALERSVKFLQENGIPHIALMPATLPLPVLAAFFHLHPDPDPWIRNLLLKWLWRGWVHGFGRRGQTPALRQAVRAVNPKKSHPEDAPSDEDAVLSLLKTVPDDAPSSVQVNPFRTDKAAGRLLLLALASLRPRSSSGEVIDIPRSLNEYGSAAIGEIVKNQRADAAARTFWLPGTPRLSGHESLDVLRSHGISSSAASFLASGSEDAFLDQRRAALHTLTLDFLTARVDAKGLVRRSLSSLVVEDENDEERP